MVDFFNVESIQVSPTGYGPMEVQKLERRNADNSLTWLWERGTYLKNFVSHEAGSHEVPLFAGWYDIVAIGGGGRCVASTYPFATPRFGVGGSAPCVKCWFKNTVNRTFVVNIAGGLDTSSDQSNYTSTAADSTYIYIDGFRIVKAVGGMSGSRAQVVYGTQSYGGATRSASDCILNGYYESYFDLNTKESWDGKAGTDTRDASRSATTSDNTAPANSSYPWGQGIIVATDDGLDHRCGYVSMTWVAPL